jgi:hypothetical protein
VSTTAIEIQAIFWTRMMPPIPIPVKPIQPA